MSARVDSEERPLEAPACDECGTEPAPVRVDSPLGLAAWNRHHPSDQRTALWFCSTVCTFRCGLRHGQLDGDYL